MTAALVRFLALALTFASTAVAAGTVEELSIDSPSLDRPLDVRVYVPDAVSGPVPTVYLLHGYGGGSGDWIGAGKAEATADAMFAAPNSIPMLLVMPSAGNSWYVNSPEHGPWEDAIVRDLIPAIDALYPTRATRDQRFTAGLSMGGYGALRLAVHHPDLFRAAAAFSPAIFDDVETVEDFPGFQLKFFAGAFGEPLDVARFNRNNIFAGLSAIGSETPVDFYVMTGDHDGLGLWDGALKFFRRARSTGHSVELRVHDGNHEWRLWRDELAPALQWFADLSRRADQAQ